MLTQLLDVFGFLSVLLRAGVLAFQSLVLGGAVFSLYVLGDLRFRPKAAAVFEASRRLILRAAIGLAIAQFCYLALDSAILAGTAGLSLVEIAGANFFIAGAIGFCAAAGVAVISLPKKWTPGPQLLALAGLSSLSLMLTSHAAGRVEQRLSLGMLTALHQSSAALWIGGIPYLIAGLGKCFEPYTVQTLCRRFSRLALVSVTVLAASGWAMSVFYVGSAQALYGTSYGAMVACKAALFAILLILGAMNFYIVRQPIQAAIWLLPRLRRFTEAEAGVGFTIILAAASLTSQPPAVDAQAPPLAAAEIMERMSPRWPRLQTPELSSLSPATPLGFDRPERTQQEMESFVPGATPYENGPGDIAWSEYNHHWAGLIVLFAGVLAIVARSGIARWTRHWPLTFLGLAAFLFLRADPENWPLGPRSFWQSFAVADVLEHRLLTLLVVLFAGFEWSVRTGRIVSSRAQLVFPSICALGGALLLTHSHALGNVKEETLAELSHIPLGIFATAAGWSRWLELRLPPDQRRIPAWIWPVCFALIGLVLLNYRES